jgi:hypothetical protein
MIHDVYTLPEITFVGGITDSWMFELVTLGGAPFELFGGSGQLSVVNYSNKTGAPVLTLPCSVAENEDGFFNLLRVDTTSADTVELFGRYVYQLTLRDGNDETDVPGQGILIITKNIDPAYTLG